MAVDHAGHHGVVQPLVAVGFHIELGAKGSLVGFAFGAGVHQAALRARKRRRLGVVFQEVLPHLGPDLLQHETQVADDGVVAPHRAVALPHIACAYHTQPAKQQQRQPAPSKCHHAEQAEQGRHHTHRHGGVAHRVEGIEFVQQHGWLQRSNRVAAIIRRPIAPDTHGGSLPRVSIQAQIQNDKV